LIHVYGDSSLEDGQTWRDVSAIIRADGRADTDVLLNIAPAGRLGLLYYDKSRLRWYTFVEEPAPLQPRAQIALERYVANSPRIWLTAWKTAETDPNLGFEAWLAARYYQVLERDFGKPARLLLYERSRHQETEQQNIQFGGMITLQGAHIEQREVEAGSLLCLHFTWRAAQAVNETLIEFIHVVDASGRVRAQLDRVPLHGFKPAASWVPGETFDDYLDLPLADELETGMYQVYAGMYRWPSLERLTVAGVADNLISLGAVQVKTAVHPNAASCYAQL
jgi:hypothetical protein